MVLGNVKCGIIKFNRSHVITDQNKYEIDLPHKWSFALDQRSQTQITPRAN